MTTITIDQAAPSHLAPGADSDLRITATSEEWLKKLRAVKVAVSGRPPLPILSGMLIKVEAGFVTLSGYDYESYAIATLEIEPATQEDITELVPMWWILGTIRTLTKGKPRALVTFAAKNAGTERLLTISTEGYTLPYMNRMPITDYPEPDAHDIAGTISIDRPAFSLMMKRVAIVASNDDTLPILTAVNLRGQGTHLSAQATDRYRLASERIPNTADVPEFQFLLKAATWKAICPHLDGNEVQIDVLTPHTLRSGEPLRLRFTSGNVSYILTGVGGEFPKIDTLFSDQLYRYIEVDRAALLSQVNVARELSPRNTPAHVFMTSSSITVRPTLEDVPDADAIVTPKLPATVDDPTRWQSDPAVAFNPTYFHEALQAFTSDRVRLSFATESMAKPVCVTAGSVSSTNLDAYRHLIMPVRMPDTLGSH